MCEAVGVAGLLAAGFVSAMTTGVRSPNENVVKLNVGGTRFWTSRETLLSSGAFYFEALLSGDYANVMDDEGAVRRST